MTTTSTGDSRQSIAAVIRHGFVVNARVLVIAVLVVALMLFFDSQSQGAFLTERNLSILIRQATVVGIAAMAMAMIMIMREIDLSFGSSVYLCAVALAIVARDFGGNMALMIAAALIVGLLLGLWQAFWVVVMRVPAFVATLGGLLGFRAIGLVITGASPISVPENFTGLSEDFIPAAAMGISVLVIVVVVALLFAKQIRSIGWSPKVVKNAGIAVVVLTVVMLVGQTGSVPTSVIWIAAVALGMYLYTARTRIGRNNFVVGANREAANLAGINSNRLIFGAFVLLGVFYAICAVLSAARLGSVGPQLGTMLELDAIAASVIGGVSLTGGRGSVLGALGGALLLSTIDNGLNFMDQIDSNYQPVIKALILIAAVGIDMRFQRRQA